jgi:type I site-specific restriction-modification system R (restriction) subunit
VKEKGVGQRYLIQHSAGSGKSNSIAWLAINALMEGRKMLKNASYFAFTATMKHYQVYDEETINR